MTMTSALMAVVDGIPGTHGGIDPMIPMVLSVFCLILVILPILLFLIILYHKKKFQHQQILAAMEKGLPVTDLIARPNNKEAGGIKSIAIGIGFLFIGIVLGGVWWWMAKDRGESISPKYAAIPIGIAGLGLMFLIMGVLSHRGITWMWGLSIGIGFLCAGFALYGLWLWTHTVTGVTHLPTEFVIIPIAVGSLGLVFLLWGLYQKNSQKQRLIMEAMEKGLPVDDLFRNLCSREINWIRSLSVGIAFLFVGLSLAVMWFWSQEANVPSFPPIVLIIALCIAGAGLFFLVRGIMLKMKEKAASAK